MSYVASAMLTQQRVDWTHAAYSTLSPTLQSPPLAVAQAAVCKGSQSAWMGVSGTWLTTLPCAPTYYTPRSFLLTAQTTHQPWTEAAFNSTQQNLLVPATPTPNATPKRVSVYWTGVLGAQATHTLTETPTNTPAPPTETPTPVPTFIVARWASSLDSGLSQLELYACLSCAMHLFAARRHLLAVASMRRDPRRCAHSSDFISLISLVTLSLASPKSIMQRSL
jgi:hypothetical protein